MSQGTIIYVGGFRLPDKNAAAHRVTANGKIFNSLGYNTVFLGKADSAEHFWGIRRISEHDEAFEEAYPHSLREWVKCIFNVKNIETVADSYSDVKMIVLYNLPFVTLLRVKRAFSRKNVKIAYDCTEWTKDTEGSFFKRAFKFVDEIFVRRFIHKVADGLIVISRLMEINYQKHEAVVRIPPLVDLNDSVWHQKPNKHRCFEFCFAGGLDGNKESLDKIVEAFSLLENSDIFLRIVGVTKEEFCSFYSNSHISELIDERISFVGKVSHSKAIKYILNCDCYIFIRESDRRNNAGFPTKFAEAFTCNAPIITTAVSDIPEYLKLSDKICLLNAVSVEEIVRAMRFQVNNTDVRRVNSLNQSFHYKNYIEDCQEWINKVL